MGKPYHYEEPAIVEVPAINSSPVKINAVTKHQHLDANFDKEKFCEDEDDGEDHVVVQKRVAVRLNPDTKGTMLDSVMQGQTVRLYDWDEENAYRRIKFKTRDGDIVDAWVMVEHPKLGTLLQPVAKEDDV